MMKKQINSPYKRLTILFCGLILLSGFFPLPVSGEQSGRLYTAYNLFKWPSHNMICLNFNGTQHKINAGTLVKNVKIIEPYGAHDVIPEKNIRFTVVGDKGDPKRYRTYQIRFIPRYHTGKTVEDYKDMMFTTQTFDELIAGFTNQEKDAIRNGRVVNGMSKEAVFMCLGPPGERNTPSLDSNRWLYYANKRKTFIVEFKKNEETMRYEIVHIR